jgi:hypothetical protein
MNFGLVITVSIPKPGSGARKGKFGRVEPLFGRCLLVGAGWSHTVEFHDDEQMQRLAAKCQLPTATTKR